MKRFFFLTLLLCWEGLTIGAKAEFPLPVSSGGWTVEKDPAAIQAMGIDPGKLDAFGRWNIENNWGGQSMMAKSCIVVKDGKIIGEWYADQNGNTLSPEFGKTMKARLASNGQTIAMALFGILVRDRAKFGLPEDFSLNSNLYDNRWLPEGFPLSDARKGHITFDHVFRHSSGILPEIAGNDRGGERSSIAFTLGNFSGSTLSKRLYFTPGAAAQYLPESPYSSVAFNHLSLVFRNITGKPAHEFLEDELLHPIGITNVEYSTELEPRDRPWLEDDIKWIASGGIWLTPRDYARFGQLMLNEGAWNGAQLLPENWIEQFASTGEYPNLIGNKRGFWTQGKIKGAGFRKHLSEFPEEIFSYSGSGLNWTYVIPSKNMVIIRTSRIFSVDEQAIEKEFLTRLYDTFTKEDNKPVSWLPGQIINDPVNRSHLVRNIDNNKDGIYDAVFYCGPGNPGGFLYRGIRNEDGTRSGDQEALLKKLSENGGNSITVTAVRTHGGNAISDMQAMPDIFPDIKQNPWIRQDPSSGLDQLVLDQWDTWFEMMEQQHVSIHFNFYDERVNSISLFGDGKKGSKGVLDNETAFVRSIVERFKHHPNIIWCLNGSFYDGYDQPLSALTQIVETIRQADEYRHIISLSDYNSLFPDLSDINNVEQLALSTQGAQTDNAESLHQWLNEKIDLSLNRYNLYLKQDPVYQKLIDINDRKSIRVRNWAAAMTGTSVMLDGLEIDKIPDDILKDCKNLSKFFSNTYVNHMNPRDELSFGGTKYLLAAQSRCYIAYTDHQAGTLGIRSLPAGRYLVQWYDIEKGELSSGKIEIGNTDDYQWNIPSGFGSEVALYLVREDFTPEYRSIDNSYSISVGSKSSNQTPQAKSQKFSTSTNAPVEIPLSYEDEDGGPGPYTITILQFPEKGNLSMDGNNILYIPNDKVKGPDQIKWQVSDGLNNSEVATIDIYISKK